MPFHELKNIAPIFLRVGTLTSSSASATLSDDSTANPPKPMRQNAWPIRALAGFKRLISVIKYQELMPDPFDAAVIERKIGALQKRHARTARFYTLKHSAGRLEITRDEEKMKNALAQCGDYVLKTDKSLGATQLWELYMTLRKAKTGFCQLKGTLGLRPKYAAGSLPPSIVQRQLRDIVP